MLAAWLVWFVSAAAAVAMLETEAWAPAWSQMIATLFRSRLTWAIAGVLLIVVSNFAIYFVIDRGNVEQRLANRPVNVEHGTKDSPAPVNTDREKQKLAGVPQLQRRRRSRATRHPSSLPEPMLLPNSASLVKPLRMEIQTKDPMIRIIWFVQPETKPVIPGPKGT